MSSAPHLASDAGLQTLRAARQRTSTPLSTPFSPSSIPQPQSRRRRLSPLRHHDGHATFLDFRENLSPATRSCTRTLRQRCSRRQLDSSALGYPLPSSTPGSVAAWSTPSRNSQARPQRVLAPAISSPPRVFQLSRRGQRTYRPESGQIPGSKRNLPARQPSV